MREGLRTARGVARSLRIYYGDRRRRTAMEALYGRFVKPGDLVFDVGSHVGDRVAAFRRLGARVIELRLNLDNPTVSTASANFVRAAHGARGWEGQAWTKSIRVPMMTLDALIARHGRPGFIKIDVEGFEAEVLGGLTQPTAALSFEFTTIQRETALACVERCRTLGYTRFDAALGESQTLVHGSWIAPREIARWLANLPDEANSGDVYAALG